MSNRWNKCDIYVEPTPAGVNPYEAFCPGYVPKHLFRCLDTPERVSEEIIQVMFYRKIDAATVCHDLDIDPVLFDTIRATGKGPFRTMLSILDYLGIVPVTLPAPMLLETGEDRG